MTDLTAERLRELFDYDSQTGVFVRKISRNRRYVGRVAGSLCGRGYVWIKIGRVAYAAHRLAWLYVHGEWPPRDIDHDNLDKSDAAFLNLRLATKSQNAMNVRPRRTNKSGFKGVCFKPKFGKWAAHIWIDKRQIYLGAFNTPEAASAAYQAAAEKHFGSFAGPPVMASSPPLSIWKARRDALNRSVSMPEMKRRMTQAEHGLTADRFRALFEYCPDTGEFFRRKKGNQVGFVGTDGYLRVTVDDVQYSANRLAWLYMTGAWPQGLVDHRDGDITNNIWKNLRDVTHAQNGQNRSPRSNATGYRGVCRDTDARRQRPWRAQIRANGRTFMLGRFTTPDEAEQAYLAAAEQYHGEFMRRITDRSCRAVMERAEGHR